MSKQWLVLELDPDDAYNGPGIEQVRPGDVIEGEASLEAGQDGFMQGEIGDRYFLGVKVEAL